MRSRPWLRHVGALALLVVCASCATPPSDEELDAELRQIAARVKPRGELRLVGLNAGSKMDSWAQLAESTAEGTEAQASKPARRLARAFAYGAKKRVAVVTGGPFASLNELTLNHAFQVLETELKVERVPGLTLVYVSPDPPTPELRAAVKRTGASLVHAPPTER